MACWNWPLKAGAAGARRVQQPPGGPGQCGDEQQQQRQRATNAGRPGHGVNECGMGWPRASSAGVVPRRQAAPAQVDVVKRRVMEVGCNPGDNDQGAYDHALPPLFPPFNHHGAGRGLRRRGASAAGLERGPAQAQARPGRRRRGPVFRRRDFGFQRLVQERRHPDRHPRGPNLIRITTDYARLPVVQVPLSLAMGKILQARGDSVFLAGPARRHPRSSM